MKDLNFFAFYSKDLEKRRVRLLLLTFAGAVVLFAAFCAFTLHYSMELRKTSLRYSISSNRAYLESAGTTEMLTKYDSLNSHVSALKKYNETVERMSNKLIENSLISTDLLKRISDNIPESVVIGSMSLSGRNIGISGEGENEEAIAEFERNMRLQQFDVFVSGMSHSEAGYTFSMSLYIKEVAADVQD